MAYIIPKEVIDKKEEAQLNKLNERYNKLTTPNVIQNTGKIVGDKVAKLLPENFKLTAENVKNGITEGELVKNCLDVVAKGFKVLEENAAKVTVSESKIIKEINEVTTENDIKKLEDICFARGYDISRIVSKHKLQNLGIAAIEGGGTGILGFPGLPLNIVLSLFIYFRAVQSIAMFYGYDVKNDSSELIIASEVFSNALSPKSAGSSELGGLIGKVLLITELTTVKQTVSKSWAEMAAKGGLCLLVTQIRALANKAAQKALVKAGQKSLEESVFKGVLEQMGKGMTQKTVGKAVPVVGGLIGLLFDTSMMNTVVEYADVFYNKRFLIEKGARIGVLTGNGTNIIDVDEDDLISIEDYEE